MYDIICDIPAYARFRHVELIDKGWSADKKYRADMQSGERLLLRMSGIAEYEKKKLEFDYIKTLSAMGIPMSQPVDFGVCGGEYVFMLLTWIDGQAAITAIPELPKDEQYALGYEAGAILKKIHSLPAPEGTPVWADRFNAKIDRIIRIYNECPIKLDGTERILKYIQGHRRLLEGRPNAYQHGDYHIGNMILSGDKRIHIIDFNRQDYGDPWEEYNRVIWSADASGPFAAGSIKGYFDNNVPAGFFPLLKLYIANNILGGMAWALTMGGEEVITQCRMTAEVLRWYDNMEADVPSWYAVKS